MSSRVRAEAVLLGLTAIWGSTFLFVKDALTYTDPFSFLVFRSLIGAVLTTMLARRAVLDREGLRGGALLGVFLFCGFGLWTYGLQFTTPSRSAFITGLNVVLVPFVSIAALRKIPKVTSLAGAALAVLGLYLMTFAQARDRLPGQGTLLGDMLTLGGALFFAMHTTFIEKLAPGRSPSGMVAAKLWTVCILSAACLPFFDTFIRWSLPLTWAVLFTGVVSTALAFTAQTWAQSKTSAVRAALVYSLEPVFVVFFAGVLRGARLTTSELFGGALILAGVLVAELGPAVWGRTRA